MMLLHEQPQLVTQLSPSHYANGVSDPFAQVICLDGAAYAADVVAEMPGMAPIADKMRAQLSGDYSERLRATVSAKNTAFPVIAHGDLWLNNIMINAEQKKAIIVSIVDKGSRMLILIDAVRFQVDFQNCFVGSPAIDLQFFCYTSLQLDVLLHHRDQLLQHYNESLCQTLTALNYPGSKPSYAQLLDEMERCLFYGYYGVVCELPICCVSKDAAEDFTVHTFIDAEAIRAKRQQLFANERVLQTLKATLGHFEQQGILNAL